MKRATKVLVGRVMMLAKSFMRRLAGLGRVRSRPVRVRRKIGEEGYPAAFARWKPHTRRWQNRVDGHCARGEASQPGCTAGRRRIRKATFKSSIFDGSRSCVVGYMSHGPGEAVVGRIISLINSVGEGARFRIEAFHQQDRGLLAAGWELSFERFEALTLKGD